MEFRQLRSFIIVAEELSFSRAAQRLNISQPPLSQQILRLEEEVGVKLFKRTTRRVELTEAGAVFLHEARARLGQLERAAKAAVEADAGEAGNLDIATFTNSDSGFYGLLVRTLRAFGRRFPSVQLTLHQMPTGQQIEALRENRI